MVIIHSVIKILIVAGMLSVTEIIDEKLFDYKQPFIQLVTE